MEPVNNNKKTNGSGPRQFKHTDMRRKSSVVYSTSVGKNLMYTSQDLPMLLSKKGLSQGIDEDEEEENEEEGEERERLLSVNNTLGNYSSMNNMMANGVDAGEHTNDNNTNDLHELIEEERELLIDNKLIDSNDLDSNDIVQKWNHADSSKLSTTYNREYKTLLKNATPLVFTFLLQNSLSLASIFSVSHLGTKELGAITLGSMTANICGFAAIQGLCTCLDTLCSQAYGANKYHLVGIFLQRCCIITILAFIPVQLLWFFYSEALLSVFIPQKELCVLAAKYLKIMVFSLPPFIIFECTKRFLQCQGIFHASTIVLLFCAPLNAVMNYLLVWNSKVGLGYLGAPISIVLNYWLMCIGLIAYIIFTKNKINPRKCWGGIIKKDQIFHNCSKMIGLAIPGIIMVEAEFLGFEILTIFAAKLGEDQLAAQSIIATVASFAYQIPFSISISTSTRVANFIGAGLWRNCLITCKSSLCLSLCASTINMTLILLGRDKIARVFSNDPFIIQLVKQSLPILAVMQLFDAFNACTAGCLRGQGQQRKGSIINITAFYVLGVPMAFILTFYLNLPGVTGLWLGIVNALIFMTIFQSKAVFSVDWSDLVKQAELRNQDQV